MTAGGGSAQDGGVDFARTPRTRKPNAFWVCPKPVRPDADRESPEFPLPVARLIDLWRGIADGEPRFTVLREADLPDGGRRIVGEQRSRVFRLPDRVTLEFREAGDGRSTVLMHSAAVYGYRDFGVNRKRIERWLAELDTRASAAVDG